MEGDEMDSTPTPEDHSCTIKRERNFPVLDLKDQSTLSTNTQPVLVIQSPKTPTLSRKLKAVSLDSEPQQQTNSLEVSRDVFSMPNTPKRQIKQKLSCDFDDRGPKSSLAPSFSSNLKKFASNNSISGSQTLKTLPEINALQDFSDCPVPEPQKIRTRGLLERRGSNASLTIDLGSTQNIAETKPVPLSRLNTAKSVSNLYLSSMSTSEKCVCAKKCENKSNSERRKSQEACGNCTIYESIPKNNSFKPMRCQNLKRCNCCAKSRRKSLSNENLYVPPCGFCESEDKDCPELRNCKGNNRKAIFPRQPDLEESQLLSDDFKLHLQNIQYLQTAGNPLSMEELRQSCDGSRVPKLHQEFWEVPLNLQEKCCVSGSQSKNRYRGVVPNEHSRVHLGGDGYIHANYIKGPDYTEIAYIATQGPLAHTCTDFWEMVWNSHCKCIIMLTGLVEKGRNKCELYFPLGKPSDAKEKTFFYVKTPKVRDKFTFDSSKNYTEYDIETYEFEEKNEISFGKYHITYISKNDMDECQIRQFYLRKIDANVEPRLIYHYWLSNWPDHKMANPEQVLKIALDVLRVVDDISAHKESLTTNIVQTFDLNTQEDISCAQTTFSFDVKEITVTHCDTDTYQVSEAKVDSVASKTVSCAYSGSTKFDFDSNQVFSSNVECDLRHQEAPKSREGSISEFNKETLSNRCSLDSKLGHLNKLSGQFKRDVCMGPLKGKAAPQERKKSMENQRLPIVVHCSAGIGRTGCFLAILNGIKQLAVNDNVDVLAILCSLRLNRGGMVQTAEQYELIHRVLSLYSRWKTAQA